MAKKTITLEDLRPADGSTHKTKRVGRGRSSGRGKTSCRGHNGEGKGSARGLQSRRRDQRPRRADPRIQRHRPAQAAADRQDQDTRDHRQGRNRPQRHPRLHPREILYTRCRHRHPSRALRQGREDSRRRGVPDRLHRLHEALPEPGREHGPHAEPRRAL